MGQEGTVLRKTLIPFTYYALFTGSLGYAVVWSAHNGRVNGGSAIALSIVVFAIATVRHYNRRPMEG